MRDYDDWKLTNPDDHLVDTGTCIWCKDDIYYGDSIYETLHGNVHSNPCFEELAADVLDAKRITAGDE
jgi:hypothetical protein